MTSPFPGMDPYLEQYWGDVHHRLITYACDQLQALLPSGLRARVEERVFVESPAGRTRSLVPDIRVVERNRRRSLPASGGGLAVAEPLVIELDEPMTQGFIEIIDAASGKRVVTVIEVLSLANKVPGEGRDKYRQKQRELRDGGVSSVEIDLLRAGERPLPVPVKRIPASYRTPYQLWLRRGWQTTAKDVPLDLQALIEQCYQNGAYDRDIDYQLDPDPLSRGDARWADSLLRKAGRRLSGRKRR